MALWLYEGDCVNGRYCDGCWVGFEEEEHLESDGRGLYVCRKHGVTLLALLSARIK